MDNFVSYLTHKRIVIPSLKVYIVVVRSYLMFYEIDIVPSKFKRRVKMPRFYSDPEEHLSLSDIRDLLEFCSNTRLRTYILLLVSSGLRATEAASLRMVDVDMTSGSPTKITVRTEYSRPDAVEQFIAATRRPNTYRNY